MKKLANLIPSIMIALMLLIMAGCSGGGEDDVVSANSETSGNPGVGITATSYDKASTITLMKDSGTETGYVIIDNGAELSLNEKVRLGVKVEDGAYPVEKVLVGDGG